MLQDYEDYVSNLFLRFNCSSNPVTSSSFAYAADIQMGSGGNLIFEPNEVSIDVGDTVTFTNGDLPPHNVVFLDNDSLSHPDLSFVAGESFNVTFDEPGRVRVSV